VLGCGNGVVEGTEQCDLGANNGQPGFCCSATCQFVSASTVCRVSAGVCDVAENCTESSATCPADGFKETGTGSSPFCPASYTVSPAAFSYRTIAGTNLNLDDDAYADITSPFPVRFGGGSFTSVYVGSNGNLNFSAPLIAYVNDALPTASISTLVAPFWDDLYAGFGSAQNVFWEVTGMAPNRELVIEWRDVRSFSCSGDDTAPVKFQVVFFEGLSDILFNYDDVFFDGACAFANQGASATVGVQVATNSVNQYSLDTATLANGTALLWTLPPAISVMPRSQDFGRVAVGSSADQTFTVQNAGGGTPVASASTFTPFSDVSGSAFSLSAGASKSVVVRFRPTSEASYRGNVKFQINGSNISRGVTGIGISSPPQISVTPASQDFGTVAVGGSAQRTFTVRNTGGGTLTWRVSAYAPFSVVSGSPFSLVAGASQVVAVRFSPTANGSSIGTIDFTSNGGNASRSVSGNKRPNYRVDPAPGR
jgi:hypothetical protein